MADYVITGPNSSLAGTNVDDVFTTQIGDFFLFHPSSFSAGEGNDRLILNPSAHPIVTPQGTSGTYYFFGGLGGIETVQFASQAGQVIYISSALASIAPGTTLIGGAGNDNFSIEVTAPGDYTVPAFDLANWTPYSDAFSALEDFVLLGATDSGDHVLRAREGLATGQVLIGGKGHDEIYGSSGNDVVTLSFGGDNIYAGKGFDTISTNGLPFFTITGGTIDGGEGTDFLAVSDVLNLIDVNVENVEIVLLQQFPVSNQPAGQPFLNLTYAGQFAAPTWEFRGQGAFGVNLSQAGTFDGSGISFAADAKVAIGLNGSAQADSIIGTSRADTITGDNGGDMLFGGAGDDVLDGGIGSDVMIGGTGNDKLYGGAGTDIFSFDTNAATGHDRILDFTDQDFLVTTKAIYDSNNDGIIAFGRNKLLDFDPGSDASLTGANGKAVTALEHDGSFVYANIRYEVYSLVHSALDYHLFFGDVVAM